MKRQDKWNGPASPDVSLGQPIPNSKHVRGRCRICKDWMRVPVGVDPQLATCDDCVDPVGKDPRSAALQARQHHAAMSLSPTQRHSLQRIETEADEELDELTYVEPIPCSESLKGVGRSLPD